MFDSELDFLYKMRMSIICVKNKNATSALFLAVALLINGCGKDGGGDHPKKEEAPASVAAKSDQSNPSAETASTAEEATPKKEDPQGVCKNLIALDQVPTEWQEVAGKDLLTQERGWYRLKKARFYQLNRFEDGSVTSARTITTLESLSRNRARIDQKLTCHSGIGSRPFIMADDVPEIISSMEDATLSILSMSFQLKKLHTGRIDFQPRGVFSLTAASQHERQRFLLARDIDPLLAVAHEQDGINLIKKFYRISPTRFEVRTFLMSKETIQSTAFTYEWEKAPEAAAAQ